MGRASSTLAGNPSRGNPCNVPIAVLGIAGKFMRDLDLFTPDDASRWVADLGVLEFKKALVGSCSRATNL